jgi:tRNA nucleotidyltransferase (CCA-adding enzyme)
VIPSADSPGDRDPKRFANLTPAEGAMIVEAAIPPVARGAAETLIRAGHRTVFVGGGVRDALLSRPVAGAWDLATAANPDEVTACFPRAVPTGLAHGTVTVRFEGDIVEITTFRTEGDYSDSRHPDRVTYVKDLSPDLRRRDFTVNAIAYDPESGSLVDETGGLTDLAAGVLRAVGEPRDRFREDALRALRAARFVSALGFQLAEETRAALPDTAPTLPLVSAERVRDEVDRLLLGEYPERGLDVLADASLLEIVLPELSACRGVMQNRYHRHDVYRHTLETIRVAAPRRRVRWGALCHDLGKPGTRTLRDDGEATFHGHAQLGADITDHLLERLRFPREDRQAITLLVREHLFDYQPEWRDSAVRRFLRRVGSENLADLFALRRADIIGTGLPGDDRSIGLLEERIQLEIDARRPLEVKDLVLRGEDVMREGGVSPGPEVGGILRRLLDEVLEDPELNTRTRLLARIRELTGRRGGGGVQP